MGQQRSVRIVEHDALLVIQPAGAFIDLCDDRVDPEWQNFVAQNAFGWIENFTLPRKMIDKIGYVLGVSCSRRNDRRSLGLCTRDFPGWALREKIVELRLRHF